MTLHRASGLQGLEHQVAYMSQEKKAVIAGELKKVMPKGWKYTLAVRHHSTIVLTIKSAPVDLLAAIARPSESTRVNSTYADVNHYHLDKEFSGDLLKTFEEIKAALNIGNWDRSDLQTDYFDVGHYVDINIGRWNKPFEVTGAKEGACAPKAATAVEVLAAAKAQGIAGELVKVFPSGDELRAYDVPGMGFRKIRAAKAEHVVGAAS